MEMNQRQQLKDKKTEDNLKVVGGVLGAINVIFVTICLLAFGSLLVG